jgi:hypothetical protein
MIPVDNFPSAWRIPPPFPSPSYLLGIPPLCVVRPRPLWSQGACKLTSPFPFPPHSLFPPPTVPHFNYVPFYDDIMTSTSYSLIHISSSPNRSFSALPHIAHGALKLILWPPYIFIKGDLLPKPKSIQLCEWTNSIFYHYHYLSIKLSSKNYFYLSLVTTYIGYCAVLGLTEPRL